MSSKTLRAVTVALAATAALLLIANAASAAPPPAPPPTYDLPTVINHLRWWVCGIAGTIATLFLTLGSVRYLMSNGDPSETERAKGSWKAAGIGYAMALLAPVLMTIVSSIVQAG